MAFRFRKYMLQTIDDKLDESWHILTLDFHADHERGLAAWPIAAAPDLFCDAKAASAEADLIIKASPRLKWQVSEYNKTEWWWRLYDPKRKNRIVLASTRGYEKEGDVMTALTKVIRHIDRMWQHRHNGKVDPKESRIRRELSVPGIDKDEDSVLVPESVDYVPPKRKAKAKGRKK